MEGKVPDAQWFAFDARLFPDALRHLCEPGQPSLPNSCCGAWGRDRCEPAYTPHLSFDVASVRESGDGNTSYIDNVPGNSLYMGGRLTAWGLVLNAYDIGISDLLKGLPSWAMTARYDLTAKSDSATDEVLAKLGKEDFEAEKSHMLRGLLAERFKLVIHPETRISTVYELVTTARTAGLLTPVKGDLGKTISTCKMKSSKQGIEVDSKGCPFNILLSRLRQVSGTEVVDHTGLAGVYAYDLKWSYPTMPTPEGEERYPGIVDAAREQLGLEMKATKGPVTFWVVDHIERPTAN